MNHGIVQALDETFMVWYTYDIKPNPEGGIRMDLIMLAESSVPTGDERDIVVWIILGVAALALAITSGVLSFISKKKK